MVEAGVNKQILLMSFLNTNTKSCLKLQPSNSRRQQLTITQQIHWFPQIPAFFSCKDQLFVASADSGGLYLLLFLRSAAALSTE
jgi:hypothetical protein